MSNVMDEIDAQGNPLVRWIAICARKATKMCHFWLWAKGSFCSCGGGIRIQGSP